MRKICAFFLVSGLWSLVSYGADYNAVVVADMNSGKIIHSENANSLNYPASLTKLMTLYLTFDAIENERLALDDYLIVSQNAANASPVKLGLSAGSKIKVEDAIKAVAVYSANDVARVLAENLKGGKEGNFASLMTSVANDIGLDKTQFENASGLPDDDQLCSARDMALLTIALYQHFPKYWHYFGIKSWTYNGKTYNNGNRLLGTYPGCDGMKTGYTNKSKYSLISTASRDGKHIVAVVLGAKDKDVRASVSRDLLDRGFGISSELRVQGSEVGTSGVQFGAFGSKNAADAQVVRVKQITGLDSVSKQSGNLWRVRTENISTDSAANACKKFKQSGYDCFVL